MYKYSKPIFQHVYSQDVFLSHFSPSTMLVLAKKPDDTFKAPLNTKKQAPVTVGKRKNNHNSTTSQIN